MPDNSPLGLYNFFRRIYENPCAPDWARKFAEFWLVAPAQILDNEARVSGQKIKETLEREGYK